MRNTMTKTTRMLVLMALCASPAWAWPRAGLFTGDEWRYTPDAALSGLALRIAVDLVSISTGLGGWTAGDWAFLAATAATTATLSVGHPSLDLQFQGTLQRSILGLGHFTVWNAVGDVSIWTATGLALLGAFVAGLVAKDARPTEVAVLMVEALAVAEIFHTFIKLPTGRAPPVRKELDGLYYGPARALEFWPGGTPSGHMASMYAMLTVLMYYFDEPLLWLGLNLAAVAFGAALIGDDYHWTSDVLLGGALGFAVGRWVVQHRSSRYHTGERADPVRVNFAPVIFAQGGGAAALVTF
jgi:membrane-associated phospholipid phosphatase